MNNAANAIATTVSTRALTPRQAILLALSMNTLGAFLTTEVAKTMGKGVVDPSSMDQLVVIASLVGASGWSSRTVPSWASQSALPLYWSVEL